MISTIAEAKAAIKAYVETRHEVDLDTMVFDLTQSTEPCKETGKITALMWQDGGGKYCVVVTIVTPLILGALLEMFDERTLRAQLWYSRVSWSAVARNQHNSAVITANTPAKVNEIVDPLSPIEVAMRRVALCIRLNDADARYGERDYVLVKCGSGAQTVHAFLSANLDRDALGADVVPPHLRTFNQVY